MMQTIGTIVQLFECNLAPCCEVQADTHNIFRNEATKILNSALHLGGVFNFTISYRFIESLKDCTTLVVMFVLHIELQDVCVHFTKEEIKKETK